MKNQLLPLGSIVKVKKSENIYMIMGYGFKNEADGKYYDYAASIFPIGLDVKEIDMFNKEDVQTMLFIGYQTKESIKYRDIMNEYYEDIKSGKSIEDAEKDLIERLNKE